MTSVSYDGETFVSVTTGAHAQPDLRQKMTNDPAATLLFVHTARSESRCTLEDRSVCKPALSLRLLGRCQSGQRCTGLFLYPGVEGKGGRRTEREEKDPPSVLPRHFRSFCSFLVTVMLVRRLPYLDWRPSSARTG